MQRSFQNQFFLFLFLFLYKMVPAQELPVPYLCNGKYGLANTQAELILPCIYDEMLGNGNAPFYSVKNGGLWGVINTKGEIAYPISINVENTYRRRYGPEIMPMTEMQVHPNGKREYVRTALYLLKAGDSEAVYYFNPDFPKDFYKSYAPSTGGPMVWPYEFQEDRVGLHKVMTRKGKFNFLDVYG
ncbi:MAG TPA: WG repeat-containing protein, partial [Saprospiraceae bacterium]|nr:WG repeat-containing protein [Saprospiraceae bacterium]